MLKVMDVTHRLPRFARNDRFTLVARQEAIHRLIIAVRDATKHLVIAERKTTHQLIIAQRDATKHDVIARQ
jgi:hypothetical protein